MKKETIQSVLIPILLGTMILLAGCVRNETREPAPGTEEVIETAGWTADEGEVKAKVDSFLLVAGNYDLPAMQAMMDDQANLAIVRFRDGSWQTSSMTMDAYFEDAAARETRPYLEPVGKYEIHVTEGHLAFAKADAVLYTYGVPRSNNIDYFTLIKKDGQWKFISLGYIPIPLPEEERKYDLLMFAKGYARAWCSQKPEYVAGFFSEDGSLTVNKGEAAVGREAIAGVAESFMTAFPDMTVLMDSLVESPDGPSFYWTLTGTNTGPGGTGNRVKISGVERWTMDAMGFIKISDGSFDEARYNRQLTEGAP